MAAADAFVFCLKCAGQRSHPDEAWTPPRRPHSDGPTLREKQTFLTFFVMIKTEPRFFLQCAKVSWVSVLPDFSL